MGRSVSRIDFDGCSITGNRFLQIPFLVERGGKDIVGTSETRVQLHGRARGSDGLVEFSLLEQGIAEVGMSCGIARVTFDGLAVADNRFLFLTLSCQGRTQV